MSWQHNPNGEDIISQVAKAPDAVKRQAALVLLKEGAKPRHIRKKLKMSDRQLKVVERLWYQATKLAQDNA
jgi:precorrin-6B methylase 1